MQRLTDALDFQAQALVLRAERQRVIASNIANADTPGYVARDMDFARALREATGAAQAVAPATTQPRHVALPAGARAEAQLLYTRPTQDSLDRNSVDMDRERAAFADNTVKYEATLRFVNAQARTLLDAMKGPNQA